MTCKDCISCRACHEMYLLAVSQEDDFFERHDAETCEDFKNEADYIERVNLLDGISSTEFGLDEIVDELIYKHSLDFLHDNDEDAVREFAKDLIDCIKNYIKTQ